MSDESESEKLLNEAFRGPGDEPDVWAYRKALAARILEKAREKVIDVRCEHRIATDVISFENLETIIEGLTK
jgi:hypothetical protein